MKTICILGRQPDISIAELESLFGADAITVLNNESVALSVQPNPELQDRLGGTQKIARLLTVIPDRGWDDLEQHLKMTLPTELQDMPDRKIHLGISLYGLHVKRQRLQKTSFVLKRALKESGKSVRIIPNKALALSSAQVFHNNIVDENGAEIVICRDKETKQIYIAQTIAVQNIDAYTARDQQRPKRDAKVGMLPPKLAQIIINLAVDQSPVASRQSSSKQGGATVTILDPFCGTGVILQEALLMGLTPYGTDLEPRMIEYSKANLSWLDKNTAKQIPLEVADATKHDWQPFDVIATETYLGQPFSSLPKPEKLQEVIRYADTIHKKFLQNVARQTKPDVQLCIAVPAWFDGVRFHRLPILDHLEKLGYNRTSFVHADNSKLIYHRKGQIVGRELVVLTRTQLAN